MGRVYALCVIVLFPTLFEMAQGLVSLSADLEGGGFLSLGGLLAIGPTCHRMSRRHHKPRSQNAELR